jgi:hypothetical protein
MLGNQQCYKYAGSPKSGSSSGILAWRMLFAAETFDFEVGRVAVGQNNAPQEQGQVLAW